MALAHNRSIRTRISEQTVSRLPVYLRALAGFTADGAETVSSSELAEAVGSNAATIRRDLSRLGSFGTRGTGYDVVHLRRQVERALALNEEWRVAIVGVGNLGRALAQSEGFNSGGFVVAALVDVDRRVVGTRLGELEVSDLESLDSTLRETRVNIAVIATPAPSAQDVAERLVAGGVTSILNFAPTTINVPESVKVRRVDLGAELQVLAFYGARQRSS